MCIWTDPLTTPTVEGMPSTTSISPSDAYWASRVFLVVERPSRALRAILNERGHGAREELRQALQVSRSTIKNWLPGGETSLTPEQVRSLAAAYAASLDEPVTQWDRLRSTLESDPGAMGRIDELFNRFYSDNERDAVTWLIDNKPSYFRCNDSFTGRLSA